MDLNASQPFFLLLVALNYAFVVMSLLHLIFRTNYALTQRLMWMVALWLLPVLGILGYWIAWKSRKA